MVRLAQLWRVIDRVLRIRLLRGERRREFTLSRKEEARYLSAYPQPLRDICTVMLDTGLRIGEALGLEWRDVNLRDDRAYVQVRDGKSHYARRAVPLTERTKAVLEARRRKAQSLFVFAEGGGTPMLNTSAAHEHSKVRARLGLPAEFVLHSLRHTFCTRLGEAGAEAFLISGWRGTTA